jgi:hypothetical protein
MREAITLEAKSGLSSYQTIRQFGLKILIWNFSILEKEFKVTLEVKTPCCESAR